MFTQVTPTLWGRVDVFAPVEPREPNSWICFAQANTTNQLSLLKRLWGTKVAEPLYKACRLLSMFKTDTNFGGEGRFVVVSVTPIAGVSADFPSALASQAASVQVRFFVTHRKEYAVWSLQNDVIERTKGGANAVLEVVKNEADKARRAWSRRMAARTFGTAGGIACQLATTTNLATTLATVTNRSDLAYVDKNMQLEFSSANGSGPTASRNADLRGGANPVFLTVGSVQRDAGTFNTTAILNTVPGITTSDFVANRGDYANAMTGVQGWNPVAVPTAGDNFLGYDRSADDVQRVSGVRVPANGVSSGKTMLETLEDAGAEAKLNGLDGDLTLVINPLDMARLRKELTSMGTIEMGDVKTEVGFGFSAMKISMQIGDVTVLPETWVPKGNGWLLDPSQIYLRTTGEVPKDITNGNGLLVDFTDDARQGRLGAYGNFSFENPGAHVIITW